LVCGCGRRKRKKGSWSAKSGSERKEKREGEVANIEVFDFVTRRFVKMY
jgi:hypothetical protein